MATIALPSNLEAERSVLGSMLISPSAAEIGLDSLQPDDFSDADPRNRIIFTAMQELHAHHLPLDVQTLNDQLINSKLDQQAGGTPYLFQLLNTVISPEYIDTYIDMVHEQSVLRQLLLATNRIQEQYSKGVSNIGDFILQSNDEITRIAQKRSVQGMKSAREVALAVREDIEKKSKSANKGLTGLTSGYNCLDAMTHGWQKGDLIILAARPSVGKTAFGMNLAYEAAIRGKVPVGFFSLEMGADKVMERLIASRSCVSNNDIQTGKLYGKDRVKVASAIEEISQTELFFDDTPNSKLGDLVAKATKLKATHPDLGLIVIDYLGRITYSDKLDMSARQQEVSYISGALKTLARQLKLPVICLSQLNRSVDNNPDKVPNLANLRESGAIEQDADIVMLMYRPDYYTATGQSIKTKYQLKAEKQNGGEPEPEAPQPTAEEKKANGDMSETKIIIAKNRNGQTGTITLLFQKAYSRFCEPSNEYQTRQAAMMGEVDMPE